MKWNKRYDGTKESLVPKSHRSHSPHPNAHTEQELKWIKDYHRRNPNISLGELYGKRKKFNVYAETRAQCEAKLAEMIAEKKAEIVR